MAVGKLSQYVCLSITSSSAGWIACSRLWWRGSRIVVIVFDGGGGAVEYSGVGACRLLVRCLCVTSSSSGEVVIDVVGGSRIFVVVLVVVVVLYDT